MTRTLLGGAGRALAGAVRGSGAAVRGRLAVFGTAVAGVLAVSVLLPPLVLSLARKPCDYFTLNPWLASLPHYLVSADVPLGQKAAFLPNLALLWFSSDSPWGVEWGVAVTVADLLRFLAVALLFGAYLALWVEVRDRIGRAGWPAPTSRQGGLAAALAGVLGFSTGSCSVMGCGAPVMPVVRSGERDDQAALRGLGHRHRGGRARPLARRRVLRLARRRRRAQSGAARGRRGASGHAF